MSDVPPRDGPSSAIAAHAALAAPAVASTAAAAGTAPSTPAASDVVILGPPTADGAGVHVIRAREERIETGELRPLQEGRPIVGEIVTLKPRDSNPRLCDVTESYTPDAKPRAQLGHKGPAKVATRAYREGWDEIFGAKPPTPGPAN